MSSSRPATGSTSFEDDGDEFDGWTVPGSPPGSAPNPNDWIVATQADAPTPLGAIAQQSMDRQPEIIEFLEGTFGPYPFATAGGVVDDLNELGFALETQTRPVYSRWFFTDTLSGDSVFVHEIAHQWVGDDLAVEQWQHIWLNEGFATYAEWLWSDAEGLGTVQQIFDFYDSVFPASDPIWTVTIGDPGPDALFDFAVYFRGAMTLQALRLTVGDDDFFQILQELGRHPGGRATSPPTSSSRWSRESPTFPTISSTSCSRSGCSLLRSPISTSWRRLHRMPQPSSSRSPRPCSASPSTTAEPNTERTILTTHHHRATMVRGMGDAHGG